MKRLLLAILLVFAAASPALAVGAGGNANCSNPALPVDSNGWTIFPAPTTGATYYVSDRLGDPTYDGTSPTHTTGTIGPFKTVSQAVTRLQTDTGKDDHVLFRKGDTFVEQGFAGALSGYNGKSCTNPTVIGSYDEDQPGVVDPYVGVAISSISCSAGTATITTASAHKFNKGASASLNFTVTRALPAGFNGDFSGTATYNGTTISLSVGTCPAASDTVHGWITTRRPLFELSAGGSLGPSDGGNPTDFYAVVGIELYGYKNDPGSASFDRTDFNLSCNGPSTLAPMVWRLYEDIKISYCLNGGISSNAAGVPAAAGWITLRRNVLAHNYGYGGGGFYMGGVNHFTGTENIDTFGSWAVDYISPTAATVTTGTPPTGGVFTVAKNLYANDTPLLITATSAPGGITVATAPYCNNPAPCYYVANSTGTTFTLSTTTGNANPVTITSAGSGVKVSMASNNPQIVTGHMFYLQNGLPIDTGVWDINLQGNISAFQSADTCECGSNSSIFDNLFYQSAAVTLGIGKAGQFNLAGSKSFSASYNLLLETTYFYSSPYYQGQSTYHTACCGWGGMNVSVSNNLLAIGTQTAKLDGNDGGISPQSNQAITPFIGTSYTNNVICGLSTPVHNLAGQVVTATVSTPGSGYTSNTSTGRYWGSSGYGIKLVGGHGMYFAGTALVNGATGAISSFDEVYQGDGVGYRVGDVLTLADNSEVGGAGSGFQLIVDSINAANGRVSSYHIVGGSGYIAPYNVFSTGGTGSNGNFVVAISGGAVTKVYPLPAYGNGYVASDLLGLSSTDNGGTPLGGTGAQLTVSSVLSADTFTNNTLKAGDCNNLNLATTPVNGIASAAPPGTPSATPPTDVVGSYFQTLAYGYQVAIPGVLSLSSAPAKTPADQTTTWELGFTQAIERQQKGNWDTNLTAHAVNNWARPQFGMVNP